MDKDVYVSRIKDKIGSYTYEYFLLFANYKQIAIFGYDELVHLRKSIDKVCDEVFEEARASINIRKSDKI